MWGWDRDFLVSGPSVAFQALATIHYVAHMSLEGPPEPTFPRLALTEVEVRDQVPGVSEKGLRGSLK